MACQETTEARHRDRHLTKKRSGPPKKRTQGNSGSRRKLAAARRTTCRAAVARRRGPSVTQGRRKKRTRNDVAKGAPKGRTFGRRRKPDSKRKNGTRNRGLRLQLRRKWEFTKTLRKTIGLEIARRIAGFSVRLRKIQDWKLWRGRPPSKRLNSLLEYLT
jgi:hypothetical protein